MDSLVIHNYSQVVIFVQKVNDLDTCACACAIAETIKHNFGEEKTVSIRGVRSFSRLIPEIRKYKRTEIDWEKDTLVILSEICDIKQIEKEDLKDIRKAAKVVVYDHHTPEDSWNELLKIIGEKSEPIIVRDEKMSSVCEVLWNDLKNSDLEVPKSAIEMMFKGLYGDSGQLSSKSITSSTFRNIAEMIERGEIDASSLIMQFNQKPIFNLKLFAKCVIDAVSEGNMLFVPLNPKHVREYMPHFLLKNKDGKPRTNKMLTYIIRWLSMYVYCNTLVFVHYSPFDPYSADRFVYVELNKPNPALESVLKANKFNQQRNRWSRQMPYYELIELIEKYKDVFTS